MSFPNTKYYKHIFYKTQHICHKCGFHKEGLMRCKICLTSFSFKTILILFASSYKDIASIRSCFFCLKLLSTTLKYVRKVVDSVGVDKNNLTLVLSNQQKRHIRTFSSVEMLKSAKRRSAHFLRQISTTF